MISEKRWNWIEPSSKTHLQSNRSMSTHDGGRRQIWRSSVERDGWEALQKRKCQRDITGIRSVMVRQEL